MKNLLIYFSAIAVIFFSSCAKEGATGPQGPPGTNGVANIQVFTFTTTNSSWSYDATSKEYYVQANVDAITQDVLDFGTVEMFWGDGTGTLWQALPYNIGYDWFTFLYFPGGVQVDYGLVSTGTPSNPGGEQFKIVVIPPAQRLANPNVNYKDYNDIARHFKIREIPL